MQRGRESRKRPVALLQTLLLGALVLVAVVSLNYSLPHAGRGPARAGAVDTSGTGIGTHQLAGRKLGAGESHQHAEAGKKRATMEASADAGLTVQLHCADQASDCELRWVAGQPYGSGLNVAGQWLQPQWLKPQRLQ